VTLPDESSRYVYRFEERSIPEDPFLIGCQSCSGTPQVLPLSPEPYSASCARRSAIDEEIERLAPARSATTTAMGAAPTEATAITSAARSIAAERSCVTGGLTAAIS
jgi:hypothetical protein